MTVRFVYLMVALAGLLGTGTVLAQSGGAGAATTIAGAASQQITQPGPRPLQELGRALSFNYYFNFLGPSPGLGWGETYNVFRDSNNNSPYQMFHQFGLHYILNPRWSMGATLAAVNDVSKKVHNGSYLDLGPTTSTADNRIRPSYNYNEREWFNARLYVNLPITNFTWGWLTTQFAWELPTSEDAKPSANDPQNRLQYGLVLTNSLAFYMPNPKWAFGFTSQIIYYRYDKAEYDPFPGATTPTKKQTMLITVGPYLNYMLTDSWQLAGRITLDWDQQGVQGITEYNNNLPHFARFAVNRFWKDSLVTQTGIYTQVMLEDAGLDRTVLGFDFSVRF